MLKIVMSLCKGCGRVLSSYALLLTCVQTDQSVVRVDVMCAVYCVTPECVRGYIVVIARWKALMESVSECSPQVQRKRSLLVIVAPAALLVVQFSGRFLMRVLMCLSVLLNVWDRCVYDVLLCGVVMSFFGSGCGEWLVSVLGVVLHVCWTSLVGVGVAL
jgi:hypothetical protein